MEENSKNFILYSTPQEEVRLEVLLTLNKAYINEGINRFVEEKYPTNYKVNGMIGFIVKRFNMDDSISFFKDLTMYQFIPNFPYSYRSNHTVKSGKKITLYHLMLDFSSKI